MGEILNTLVQLVLTLLALIEDVGAFALSHILLIAWIAWWIGGVNWNRAWPALARGGWIVLILLSVLAALAWSAMFPMTLNFLGQVTIPNFWWQLSAVILIVLSALLCGWVQGVFGWAPPEIDLDPPALGHAEHGHH